MSTGVKALIFLGVFILGSTIALLFSKGVLDDKAAQFTMGTSDGKNIIDKIVIATDDWEGYSYACSTDMRHRMADQGYLLECKNDGAAYEERYQKLATEEIDLAFGTVDSYLNIAEKYKFPGVIVSIIDESKGGDAIMSSKHNSFKEVSGKTVSVAYVKDSPSEFLWGVVSSNFGIKYNAKPMNSPEEVYKALSSGSVDFAVLWQPFVGKAQKSGYKKIIGSESVNGLIMDVLIANRSQLENNREKILVFLSEYYAYMRDKIGTTDTGIKMYGVSDNKHAFENDYIIDSIVNIAGILSVSTDNPYTLINSSIIAEIVQNAEVKSTPTYSNIKDQLENIYTTVSFTKLGDSGWDALKKVGNLKVDKVKFKSGSSLLTLEGKEILDTISRVILQYNYRVEIRGHSSLEGDPLINLDLSRERATAVYNYLIRIGGLNENQIRSKGFGVTKPLKRATGESWRNYNKRLQRVEFVFLTD